MAGGGGGSGGGGGTEVWRLEGEGGKAESGRCGGEGGGGTVEAWDAGVLGGIGGSRGEEHEEIILESMAWAGRMGKRSILQNGLVSGMEILKLLEWSSGIGGLSNGLKPGTMGARSGADLNQEGFL